MLRLLDANLNRIGEGLRLLEDISRFIINDASLSAALKSMRHEILGEHFSIQKELLSAICVEAHSPFPRCWASRHRR